MIPVIAIVGRPNTGKSTLFNRVTRSNDALVADRPGVTRDRNYGLAGHDGRSFILIDTGGLEDADPEFPELSGMVSEQSLRAIKEADLVLWLVDGRAGLTAADEILADKLRRISNRLLLVVNKTDDLDPDIASAEFHALGAGRPYPISASRGFGVGDLLDLALEQIPESETAAPGAGDAGLRVAVVGRPNVGKSTLVNRMLGEDRMLTFDRPGTTRDSVLVPFERQGKKYELVDTAGVRKRARLTDTLEKFSVIKSLKAMEAAHVMILVVDAGEALTDQDLHLLGVARERGKPLIIAVNKWDNLEKDQRNLIRGQLDRKLGFVEYACIHYISALHGSGVGKLFSSIDRIGRAIATTVRSSKVTEILEEAVNQHPPPIIQGRRIKLRYAHIGGHNPLRIIIHGNQTQKVPPSYARYLEKYYRNRLNLTGTPVMIEFKYGDNPYKNRKNTLTPRQVQKRKRLIRHSRS